METVVAQRLLQAALALDEPFGDLDTAVSQISDEQERKVFARNLGDIIGRVNDAFIRVIAKQYPDLEPDK